MIDGNGRWRSIPEHLRELLWPGWAWVQMPSTARRMAASEGSGVTSPEGNSYAVIYYALHIFHPGSKKYADFSFCAEILLRDWGPRLESLVVGAEIEALGERVTVLGVEDESGPGESEGQWEEHRRVRIGPAKGDSWLVAG